MANLQLEITHSLSFLTNTMRDTKKIAESSIDTIEKLYKMNLKEEGAPGQLRKKADDYRKDADDDLENILADFKVYQKDMSDIVKHKNDEAVVYSLRQYRELYNKYKDLMKVITKISRKVDIKTGKCTKDKDYVKLIGINKTSVPLFQIIQVIDACIYSLEHLLDIKKEA